MTDKNINILINAKDNFSKILKSLNLGFLSTIVSIGGFVGILKKSNDAAIESNRELQKLEVSMKNAGVYTEEAYQSNIDFAFSLSKITEYTDEQIISAESLITVLTELDKNTIQNLTKSAVNLSVAMGIDLDSAAKMLSKAVNGNSVALQKLGISFEDTGSKLKNATEIIKLMTDKFEGVAEAADVDNINKFKKAIEELQETIGTKTNPSINKTAESLTNLIYWVKEFVDGPVVPMEEKLKNLSEVLKMINSDIAESKKHGSIYNFLFGKDESALEAKKKSTINAINTIKNIQKKSIKSINDDETKNTKDKDIKKLEQKKETLQKELEYEKSYKELIKKLDEDYYEQAENVINQENEYIDENIKKEEQKQKKISEYHAWNLEEEVAKLDEQKQKEKEITSKFFDDMIALQSSKSQEISNIGKAFAIYNVAIKTYEAAMNAYAAMAGIPFVGPALGAAAAATATAYGAEQIAGITAQKMATGGVVAGNSYSGDRVPVRANSGEMMLTKEDQMNLLSMLRGNNTAVNRSPLQINVQIDSKTIGRAVVDYNKLKRSGLR
jgi:hypothetical protein